MPMTHPAEHAASGGFGYAASGTTLGTVGLYWAETLPALLQIANLVLIAVSIVVGMVTLAEKVRKWRRVTEHDRQEQLDRTMQRKLLRRLGADLDTGS